MKIAIAGFGAEGRASYAYWARPDNQVVIVDERSISDQDLPLDANVITGEGAFRRLNGFDMVVRTPGLSPRKIATDGKIWSATNEFFAKCPAPIIGVTGTKGKGTTCSLIAAILHAAGNTVHLVGNIGTPALAELPKIRPEDIVVYELSSFQLWDLEKSPHAAVVLLIESDHLNVHADMDDYVAAKSNIVTHQTVDDVVIFNRNNQLSRQVATMSAARKIEYPFTIDEFISSLMLPGKHNQENAAAAIAVVREFGVNDDEIRAGLASFKGLPYRLEKVRELDGITYYNDSFSSAPSATVAAIKAFSAPEVVILGGIDKGADFTELAQTIEAQGNVRQLIIIGEVRHKLAKVLHEYGVDSGILVSDATTMTEIVVQARSYADRGDVIILSPGCASFDMFENFYDRGDQFREVVKAL